MKTLKKVLKGEKGFTLIELLIVIAIIAVLAVLIIPRITTSLDDANKSSLEANEKLIQSAVERYYFDKKEYPTDDKTDGGTTGVNLKLDLLVTGKYIDEAPTGYTFKLINGKVTGTKSGG